ncbi:MAG: pyridoxamine 5'-phosphate oxidase family protein [Flavobacteriales bacterium]|nr:pyridoxamine 5'-phosphate oxidase family protein [Flavobacteriales bacterium]
MSETKPLHDEDAIKKFKELVGHSPICHLLTSLDQRPIPSRPMSVQQVDDEGNFWFLSSHNSLKDEQVADDPYVQLLLANTGDSEFLSVFGTATIVMDMAKKRELWTPLAKAWFPNGVEDPDLTVLKVKPMQSYYWDTKNGKMVTLLKMAASAIIGKKSHSGVEGKITI